MIREKIVAFTLFIFYPLGIFAYELEPIVVKKDKKASSVILELDEIKHYFPLLKNLDLLGVDLQSRTLRADIQSDFSFRGAKFEQLGIFLNNRLINDPQTGHFHGEIPFTVEDIQNISVDSASFFSYPSVGGGKINFYLRKPEDKKTTLVLGLGNHNLRRGLFSFSKRRDNLGWRFSFENQDCAGGYPGRDFSKIIMSLGNNLEIEDLEFNLNFGCHQKKIGAYDFYTPYRGFFSYEEIDTYLLISELDINKEPFSLKSSILWRRNKDRFILDRYRPRWYANRHLTEVISPSFSLEKDFFALGKIILGIEDRKEDIRSNRLGKHRQNIRSILMENIKEVNNKFIYTFSIRADRSKKNRGDLDSAIKLKYKLSAYKDLILGISKNVRFPNFTELYYQDPTTEGNKNLCAEKFLNKEIIYQYLKDDILFKFILFSRKEKNTIEWMKYSNQIQEKWKARNLSSFYVRGLEFIFQNKVTDFYKFILHYIYTEKEKPEGIMLKYGLNHTTHKINLCNQFAVAKYGINLNFSYKKKPQRRGWFVCDVLFSYQINKNLESFFNIYNLWNEEYQDIAGIPNEKRQIEFGVRFSW